MSDDIKPGGNRLAGIDPTDLLKVSTDELAPLRECPGLEIKQVFGVRRR
jgi:hypothetical protein